MEKIIDSSNNFDNVLMDVNENPSNEEYLVNNDSEQSQLISNVIQNTTFCKDISDSTHSAQSSFNCIDLLPEESKDNCIKNTSLCISKNNLDSGIHESTSTFNAENILDNTIVNMNCTVMVPEIKENGVLNNDNFSIIAEKSLPAISSPNVSFGVENISDNILPPEVGNMSGGNCSLSNSKVKVSDIVNSEAVPHTSNINEEMDLQIEHSITGTPDSLCGGPGEILSDFIGENNVPAKDEEFQDAVQFFKDPASYDFLENAGGSSNEPFNPRSSLYMKFDPLAYKTISEPAKRSNELKEITEQESIPEDDETEGCTDPVINKHLNNVNSSPRLSVGNILISFDSPIKSNNSQPELVENTPAKPVKLYTEEEYLQALKIQELTIQEMFLKNQHDLEIERTEKLQETESKIKKQSILINTLSVTLSEAFEVVQVMSEKQKDNEEKTNIENSKLIVENAKLKEDLKISTEDLQKFESMFADFHKRYETCKGMLNDYKQNEDNLKQQVEGLTMQLQEKDEMYKALQSRMQEMVDKANTEVANAKKASEAQVAVLKAQLKKADLKISSLESDVKHVKIENEKLSSICDDLMAKVSES